MTEDTICAIASAPGQGAIALIRLSGPEAFNVISTVFKSRKKNFTLQMAVTQTIHFGEIVDKDSIIDEVLVSVFKSPNTYTGEDLIEISCHGSTYIQQKILQGLVKNGARLAHPGEFTQRAYLNGKMDLSQAEAVSDLIASQSAAAHQVAMNQMRGGFSNELSSLRNHLLQFISLIELELDFSEEDVEFADRRALKNLLAKIIGVIKKLIASFELGNAIKNGVPVAIIGEPNVGKSTLLNALLNEEKALVSDIAGTTRDSIEDTFIYEGITYRFIDTAGLRHTTDTIENMGIERTYQKIRQARIILALFNASDTNEKIKESLSRFLDTKESIHKVIVVRNKTDLLNAAPEKLTLKGIIGEVQISAKHHQSLDQMLTLIQKATHSEALQQGDVIVSNIRHLEALSLAMEALQRALTGLDTGVSTDFLAMDIREVIHHLAGITGEEISTDEVLGNIFKNFCIGK